MMITNKLAFSLMESLIAAVIFTIAVAGVYASIASVKKPVTDIDKKLSAAKCGQKVLEKLRGSVAYPEWSDGIGPLAIGTYTINALTTPSIADFNPSCVGISTVTYTVTDAGNGPNGARKAVATVIWPD